MCFVAGRLWQYLLSSIAEEDCSGSDSYNCPGVQPCLSGTLTYTHTQALKKKDLKTQTNKQKSTKQPIARVCSRHTLEERHKVYDRYIYCLMFSAGKQRRSDGGRDLASLVIVAVEESASEPTSTTLSPPPARRTQT